MPTTWENYEKATAVYKALQSDEMFEHFGPDSRGIEFQAEPFLEDLVKLSTQFEGTAREVIIHFAALLKAASKDYGGYVRIKGPNVLNIEIRGSSGTGPLPENPSEEELCRVWLRRSAVIVDVYPDKTTLFTHTAFLKATDGTDRDYQFVVNDKIKTLSPEVQTEIGSGILTILVNHVNQNGEFSIRQ